MPGYIVAYKFTQQGLAKNKDLPETIKRAKVDSEKMGIRVVGVWLTLGEYDMIAVVDAPDDQTIATRLLMTGEAGNATSQTMRAFSEEEFAQIVGKKIEIVARLP